MFPSLISGIANEIEGRLTDSSQLPMGNMLNAPDNESVSSRDTELVHWNDSYFVSLLLFFFHRYFVVFFFETLFPTFPSIYNFFQARSNGIALPVSWGLAPIENYGYQAERIGKLKGEFSLQKEKLWFSWKWKTMQLFWVAYIFRNANEHDWISLKVGLNSSSQKEKAVLRK